MMLSLLITFLQCGKILEGDGFSGLGESHRECVYGSLGEGPSREPVGSRKNIKRFPLPGVTI